MAKNKILKIAAAFYVIAKLCAHFISHRFYTIIEFCYLQQIFNIYSIIKYMMESRIKY